MISVQCSQLEYIKVNPEAYGQLLAENDGKNRGGSYGMFACFQDVAKQVHIGELDISQAVKELYKKFVRFENNAKNRKKQEFLAEQLVNYCNSYKKKRFEFVDSRHQIRMQLIPEVRLTGLTPWVVADETTFYSYTISEKDFDWEKQLRYPLFQNYIINYTIDCEWDQLKVGIYSLESTQFQFKNFTKNRVQEIIEETTEIFKNLYLAYKQRKK